MGLHKNTMGVSYGKETQEVLKRIEDLFFVNRRAVSARQVR